MKTRTLLFIALFLLAACGGAATLASGGGDHPDGKKPICHVPPGNPANAHIIHPDDASYDAHLPGKPGGHDTDYFVDKDHPCPPVETTTTKPHVTTTTTKPHATTTTVAGPTTTVKQTTTTSVGSTTTQPQCPQPPCVPVTNVTIPPTTTTTTVPPTGVTTTTVSGTTTSSTGPPTTTGPTTSLPGGTTTTSVGSTTTTSPATTTTAPPGVLSIGGGATVCIREVPTIRIVFGNTFPELAGRTGTLIMRDVAGNVVSVQSLVYTPNTTVDLLYPGTRVNPDGSIADVPGWNLNAFGFWVRDPSDEFLREGIALEYTVNPTATGFVTYPPESAACANPDGPFPPTTRPPTAPPGRGLPPTR